ncbi:hypothetical protein ACOIPL_004162 [Vibrio fluvialis]|nr:hypothetical protein [Vibrio fluvialis]
MKLKQVIALSLAGLMAGCASTVNNTYQTNHSRAYNLARAGGLYDAKDYSISKAQRESLISQGWDASGSALLFNSSKGLGLGWNQSLGFGLATTLFKPKGVMERDSLFGWVPESLASTPEQARQVMSEKALSATEAGLKQTQLNFEIGNRHLHLNVPFVGDYLYSSVQIIAPNQGCPTWEEAGKDLKQTCQISITVYSPADSSQAVPDFVLPQQTGYVFSANDSSDYSRLNVELPKRAKISKVQILSAISQHLPPWIFVFTASEKQENGKYSAPIVWDQGKAQLFVTPENFHM